MKVLIVGEEYPLPAIIYSELQQKYGVDIEIYTPKQAREAGLIMAGIGRDGSGMECVHHSPEPGLIVIESGIGVIPYKPNPMLLETMSPIVITGSHHYKSGKESRRERRARERKAKPFISVTKQEIESATIKKIEEALKNNIQTP